MHKFTADDTLFGFEIRDFWAISNAISADKSVLLKSNGKTKYSRNKQKQPHLFLIDVNLDNLFNLIDIISSPNPTISELISHVILGVFSGCFLRYL